MQKSHGPFWKYIQTDISISANIWSFPSNQTLAIYFNLSYIWIIAYDNLDVILNQIFITIREKKLWNESLSLISICFKFTFRSKVCETYSTQCSSFPQQSSSQLIKWRHISNHRHRSDRGGFFNCLDNVHLNHSHHQGVKHSMVLQDIVDCY